MEVMELAAALGKKIKEDPRVIAMQAAEKAYTEDRELQTMRDELRAALEKEGIDV